MTRRYIVRGHVQGVGYREFARKRAEELGVTGMVRNLDDGNVEVIAAGSPAQHDALAGYLHRGPLFGEVHGVTVTEHGPIKSRGFTVLY